MKFGLLAIAGAIVVHASLLTLTATSKLTATSNLGETAFASFVVGMLCLMTGMIGVLRKRE